MKIFNNFDSKIKENEYSDLLETHGKKNIILIERAYYFWIINGIMPFVIFAFFMGFFIYFYIKYIKNIEYFGIIAIGFLIILILFMLRYLINTFLSYKYDFTIITKEGLSTFKQLGFFVSKNKDLPSQKIRSIQSERYGLLGNIFGFGSVHIITDGSLSSRDEEGNHLGGKMSMTYVKNPIKLRKQIIELCLMEKNINNKNL